MRLPGRALAALLVSLALLASVPSGAGAAFLGFDRAKRAIATSAYLTNGAYAVAYGARACRRLGPDRISCQAYVEKSRAGQSTLCTDRMTAARSGGRVHVRGAAQPSDWTCKKA